MSVSRPSIFKLHGLALKSVECNLTARQHRAKPHSPFEPTDFYRICFRLSSYNKRLDAHLDQMAGGPLLVSDLQPTLNLQPCHCQIFITRKHKVRCGKSDDVAR